MVVNIFQLHGVDSLLHLLVLQRWRFLLHLHLQFSKKNDVLVQVQQPPLLHQLLHHLHIAEALFVTSIKVMGMLLLNVQVGGP